jgi:hypothetical protein
MLEDTDALREGLIGAQVALDGLVFAALDATSGASICPLAAQRADVEGHGAALRDVLQRLSRQVDAIRDRIRADDDERRAAARPRRRRHRESIH